MDSQHNQGRVLRDLRDYTNNEVDAAQALITLSMHDQTNQRPSIFRDLSLQPEPAASPAGGVAPRQASDFVSSVALPAVLVPAAPAAMPAAPLPNLAQLGVATPAQLAQPRALMPAEAAAAAPILAPVLSQSSRTGGKKTWLAWTGSEDALALAGRQDGYTYPEISRRFMPYRTPGAIRARVSALQSEEAGPSGTQGRSTKRTREDSAESMGSDIATTREGGAAPEADDEDESVDADSTLGGDEYTAPESEADYEADDQHAEPDTEEDEMAGKPRKRNRENSDESTGLTAPTRAASDSEAEDGTKSADGKLEDNDTKPATTPPLVVYPSFMYVLPKAKYEAKDEAATSEPGFVEDDDEDDEDYQESKAARKGKAKAKAKNKGKGKAKGKSKAKGKGKGKGKAV
ncbi:hypothetical protein OQA88_10643 [Cercophora sp. LCS_1]